MSEILVVLQEAVSQVIMQITGMLPALQGAVSQGVLWGILVLGVYITYRQLNISDLTVDGSFALGGCVCAVLIINQSMHPVLALFLGMASGALAGLVTGLLHTVFEIPAILAGILTQISLWSINLRIMDGKSNLSLANVDTAISKIVSITGFSQSQGSLLVGVLVAVLMVVVLYWFFGTEYGSALRATGNNEDMIRALGVNTKTAKVIALMLANALVGLSGGLVAQSQKYADIGMGTGAIVIGLAAIVIGEVLMGRFRSFGSKLFSAVIGSVVYFLIRAIVLQLGMKANDMKLLSALIVAIALCVPVAISKWNMYKSYSEEGE